MKVPDDEEEEKEEDEEAIDEETQLMASMGLPLTFASTSDYKRTVSVTLWCRLLFLHPAM